MKKKLYIFLTLLVFLSGYAGAAAAALNLYDSPRDLPSKTIYDNNNKKFKLSDFKGDFVLAVFWSRYCAPCLREMKGLNKFANKTRSDGIRVIIISPAGEWQTPEEREHLIEKFHGGDLESFIDVKGDVAESLGIFTSPNTVLINKEGKEIGRIRGAVEWDNDDVIEYIYKIKSRYN